MGSSGELRILCACGEPHYLPLLEPLRRLARVDVIAPGDEEDIGELLPRYDIYIATLKYKLRAETVAACPRLKLVATPTTGRDHLPVKKLEETGILLFSLREDPELLKKITSTAELTWGLLLALVRRLVPAVLDVRQGYWRRECFAGSQLAGKTLGVIGYGRLGRMVANYGLAFGMNVLCCDTKDALDVAPGVHRTGLEDLLKSSDVVSLHIHLDPANRGFFDTAKFDMMKPGAIFLNSARGGLIDEEALLAALRSGKISAAGLDVLACEWSDMGENILVQYAKAHDNLIITPHCGGASKDAQLLTFGSIISRIADFIRQYNMGEQNE